jgi:hypothetical protein
MTGSTKQKTLLLLGLVMLLTVMIAASLPQLELQPGMPLPRFENSRVVVAPVEEEAFAVISISKFILIFFALILTGSMLYVLYRLFKGTDWKFLTSFIPSMLTISLMALSVIFLIMLLPKSSSISPMDLSLPTATPPATAPLGPVPPLVIWLVGIGLLIITLLLGGWILLSASKPPSTLDVVGLEAEKAWQALKTGLDLKDVVVKCYRQMSLALEKEQGLEREEFMTPREFEKLLEGVGVPQAPIHQLTQLFEAVRYGNWQPNPADEQKAIHCLEAIMLYSRQAQRAD